MWTKKYKRAFQKFKQAYISKEALLLFNLKKNTH